MNRRQALAALAAAILIAGCDRLGGASPFKGIDVTGAEWGKELRLADAGGQPRSLADFRGKVVVVVFGYTHCPDVCPTTLADLAKAVKQLGNDGKQVQVLFVTVDPKRDTPELLRQYVPAFHPDFIALWGDEAAVGRVTKDFKVYASVREGKTPEAYSVDHSGQIFVFDRQGRARLVIAPGAPVADVASDLRVLLDARA